MKMVHQYRFFKGTWYEARPLNLLSFSTHDHLFIKDILGREGKKSNLRESYPSWFTIGCGKGKSARTDQAKKKLKRNILLKFYKEKDMPRLS